MTEYRDPTPPPPTVFELSASSSMQLGLALGALSLVGTALGAAFFGAWCLVLSGGLGPALLFVFTGAPRAIEVHADRLVLLARFRRPKTLVGSELTLQHMPDRLVLIGGSDTYGIDGELFASPHAMQTCADAIALVAVKTIVRRARRAER